MNKKGMLIPLAATRSGTDFSLSGLGTIGGPPLTLLTCGLGGEDFAGFLVAVTRDWHGG